MQVEWYGQSAFRLSSSEATVAIDPFADLSALTGRGMRFDYPAIAGLEPSCCSSPTSTLTTTAWRLSTETP
jgi:L-ascorbate metabolism protein UlaG (beta-lactamase superfamily)